MLNQSASAREQEAGVIAQYNDILFSQLGLFKSSNANVTATVINTAEAFDEALDHPAKYGAPDATCFNSDGKTCLWFNDYHPGIEINRLVAGMVADAWKENFF